ncbi:MAG: hypothetical protein EZS28_033123 [Streblomastix strix]|uniref:Uncharacterized protein n=1 Tax=Streblomastix strix TaxID=222440 RepID=A0A5J4UMP4_9EUKA|nr:MAG: hypothetical protein EZS28_033123 [Streblomastix strix]
MEFYGTVAVVATFYILTSLTAYYSQDRGAALQSLNKQTMSGFSGGIIAYARRRKSYTHSYKYNDAQFLVSTGNELKIGFNQFKSNTPLNVISYVILKQNGVLGYPAAIVAYKSISLSGISIKIPQWRFLAMMDSSGETLTEVLVYKSVNEFEQITAYSLAYIAVLYKFQASRNIANQLNGPQTVENPSQNFKCPLFFSPLAVLPQYFCLVYVIVSESAARSLFALKLIFALNSSSSPPAISHLFNYMANIFASIVIVQFTQHFYTIEQVASPLAANEARVYLTPDDVSQFTGQSKNYCLEIAKDQA